MTARTVRYRTRAEIIRDVLAACRRLGEIALAADLELRQPNLAEVVRNAEGLRRVLAEYAEGEQ